MIALDTDRTSRAEELGRRVCQLAVVVNGAMADLVRAAAAFDSSGGWSGPGFRSCAHWLTLNTGVDLHTANELLRVGNALASLPRCAAAFATGALSLDKVRAVSLVATPDDEDLWLELAREASGSQLTRICREYLRAVRVNAPDHDAAQHARRGVWAHWDDDGMLRLTASLPTEDGALVMAALEKFSAPRRRVVANESDDQPAVRDPADDTQPVRRAGGLVALCQRALAGDGEGAAAGFPHKVVVHVDLGVLTGEDPAGRCHLEDGPALSTLAAQRLGCDVDTVAITERDGRPLDVGRSRRIVSTPLRRALHSRDRGCRFPGCAVPVRWTHAHHIRHWAQGGRTDLANLVSLCGFHHRRLHDGVFVVRPSADNLVFELPDGSVIAAPRAGDLADREEREQWLQTGFRRSEGDPWAARARDGGRLHLDYAVSVVTDQCERRRTRAGPAP